MKLFSKFLYLFEHPYLHDTVIAIMMLLCVIGFSSLSLVICYLQCQENIKQSSIDNI